MLFPFPRNDGPASVASPRAARVSMPVARVAGAVCGLLLLGFSGPSGAQWELAASPPSDPVQILLPAEDGLYCGSYLGKVYVTTDHAQSWTEIGALDHATPVTDLVLHADWLLASRGGSSGNYRAQRTTSGWTDWELLPYQDAPLRSFTVHGGRLFAVMDGAVAVTDDHGTTWTPTAPPSADPVRFLFGAAGLLFAESFAFGADAGRLHRSANDGASWEDVTGAMDPLDMTVWSEHHGEIFVVDYDGGGAGTVYRSVDAGTSWQPYTEMPLTAAPSALVSAGSWLGVGYPSALEVSCFLRPDEGEWLAYSGGLTEFARSISLLTAHDGFLFKTGGVVALYRSPLPATTEVDARPAPAAGSLTVHPNPFNPRTQIHFALPARGAGSARVAIYDARGRRLRAANAAGACGDWFWDGRDADGEAVAAGTYRLRLEMDGRAVARSSVTLVR